MQEGIGESIGGLLQLLGMGLGARGQNKLAQQQRMQEIQGLEGIAPGYGESLSRLSPEDRKVALGKVIRDPILDFLDNRANELGGANAGPDQGQGYIPGTGNFASEGQNAGLAALGLIPPERESYEFPVSRAGEKAQARQQEMRKSLFTPEEEARIALKYPQLAAQSQRERLHGQEQEFKIGESRRKEAFQETKDLREEVRKEGKSAKAELRTLGRMETLIDEDNLTDPVLYATLKKFGLDIPAFLSADSQEFQKLTQEFLTRAKDIYGGRVTNFEVEQFLKSIPDLSQSAEGKKRIIRNMRLIAQGKDVRNTELRKILKENGGVPPLDLEDQLETRTEKRLDDLWNQFVAGAPKETPKNATEARQQRLPPPPKGEVYVTLKNGERGTIPEKNLDKFLANNAGSRLE